MRVTSSQAAKLLRQLNDELRALQLKEANSSSFVVAIQEDVESVRPEYNFKEMRDAQAEVECKIRKVKHAITCSTQQRLSRILILRSTRCLYIFLSLMRNVLPSLK